MVRSSSLPRALSSARCSPGTAAAYSYSKRSACQCLSNLFLGHSQHFLADYSKLLVFELENFIFLDVNDTWPFLI